VKTAGFVHAQISEMLFSFAYGFFTTSFVFSGVSFVTAVVSANTHQLFLMHAIAARRVIAI